MYRNIHVWSESEIKIYYYTIYMIYDIYYHTIHDIL